jgi:hypothetical protein
VLVLSVQLKVATAACWLADIHWVPYNRSGNSRLDLDHAMHAVPHGRHNGGLPPLLACMRQTYCSLPALPPCLPGWR